MADRKGYVYEVITDGPDNRYQPGDILVLTSDDGTRNPLFDVIRGVCASEYRKGSYVTIESKLKQLWPVPEIKEVEKISLMGRTYNKEELEEALKNVKEL